MGPGQGGARQPDLRLSRWNAEPHGELAFFGTCSKFKARIKAVSLICVFCPRGEGQVLPEPQVL